VVSKVEVSEQGGNTRFVVTDMEQARTKVLDQQIACARGHAENEMKDHKLYLTSDRTSCHRFEAHQFRVLWHAAASGLLETLRREGLRTTQWASATLETIQVRLLKLGARVPEFQQFPEESEPQYSSRYPVWLFVNIHAIMRPSFAPGRSLHVGGGHGATGSPRAHLSGR
jgi:Transposase DDE domain group 1